jgi:hypothetical protein
MLNVIILIFCYHSHTNNCNDYSPKEGVWYFYFFIMIVESVISHLLMPAALTLLDYQCLCLWHVESKNLKKVKIISVNGTARF